MKTIRRFVLFVVLALTSCGCAPALADTIARSVNAATVQLVAAEEAEGNAAIEAAPKDEAAIDAALADVEARWEPVWVALRAFTAAHGRWADALEQGGASGLEDVVFAYCELRPIVAPWVVLPDVGCSQ